MTALVLRLAAPLQSWGTNSRFVRRNTDRAPSKSGIIGLLAAAEGRRRTDPIEDLVQLKIGVRVEQAGHVERDFQTAHPIDGSQAMPLSYRFYLADAVFLVAVEGEPSMLAGLRDALHRPVFPLYLGRRACPPAGQVEYGLREAGLVDVIKGEPWLASPRIQQACTDPTVQLDTVSDVPIDADAEQAVVRDDPRTFDPRRREHDWRTVYRQPLTILNPNYKPRAMAGPDSGHDPWAALDGLD